MPFQMFFIVIYFLSLDLLFNENSILSCREVSVGCIKNLLLKVGMRETNKEVF